MPPAQSKKAQEQKIKELQASAPSVLEAVHSSYIFKVAKADKRDFPTFSDTELQAGPKLGSGGFSDVFEVTGITLKDDNNRRKLNAADESLSPPSIDTDVRELTHTMSSILPDNDYMESDGLGEDKHHYDPSTAKKTMAERCLRNGSARYALKKLRTDLSKVDNMRGQIDLAIEIAFFKVLWHPNIGKFGTEKPGLY